jgi:hypothetical protein
MNLPPGNRGPLCAVYKPEANLPRPSTAQGRLSGVHDSRSVAQIEPLGGVRAILLLSLAKAKS